MNKYFLVMLFFVGGLSLCQDSSNQDHQKNPVKNLSEALKGKEELPRNTFSQTLHNNKLIQGISRVKNSAVLKKAGRSLGRASVLTAIFVVPPVTLMFLVRSPYDTL